MTAPGLDLAATRQFIELVYPATVTGKLHVCATGDWTGAAFDRDDLDGLTGYVCQLDVAGREGIYHRAMTLAPGATRRGGAVDSVELVGLWSDLDFGQAGHNHDPSKYGGLALPPNEQSARKIVEVAALPEPTVWIHSGGGLYGWWLLDVPFTLTDDNRAGVDELSKRWQDVLAGGAVSLGFHYGTGVSDLARVLRLPGTVNRKVPGDPRPCRILSADGPRYSPAALLAAVTVAEDRFPARASSRRGPRPTPGQQPTPDQFIKGDSGKVWHPVDAGTGTPLGDFETRTDWTDILVPAGWTETARQRDGTRQWIRPGKDTPGISATTSRDAYRDRMWNFSDNAGLPVSEPMTKPYVYAWLNHGGDMRAAAAALSANGYGARDQSACDSERFWTARAVLTHIRDFALARRASPWAVLGVVLVRVIAATPPRVVLPALVGGAASLNLFLALVGSSGSGKGAALTAATDAVELAHLDSSANFAVHTVGSGQGIGHAYARWERGVGMKRYAESAMFVIEEIDHLVGLTGQTGSTLLPELRRLYMGERLGHLYVDEHKRVQIEAHTYRAGLIAGVQPTRAGVLLDDADGGTPQRFVWLPVTYPHPDIRPDEPAAPWRWKPPNWVDDPIHQQDPDRLAMPEARRRVTLDVASCAVAEIDVAALARARGQGDPLDGHRLLCQEKVAAALGILDQRAEVNEEDWALAGQLLDCSDATRTYVVATLATRASQQNTARAHREAARAVVIADTLEDATVKRVARSVVRILGRSDGWMPHKDLRTRLASRDRAHFDVAVEHLVAAGQVTAEPTERGVRYQCTKCGS